MKISKKIIPLLVLVISVTICIVVSIFGTKTRKANDAKKEYAIISTSVYESVLSEISKPIYTSLAIANDAFLIDLLKQENEYSQTQAVDTISKYLSAIKESTNAQTAFIVSENSKRYYTAEGLNKIIDTQNDEHDVWYPIFVNKRKSYDLDVDIDQANGNTWTVFVNARIEDEKGKLLGVCGLGLSMEHLQELLRIYENKYNIKVNFIDSDGLVQVDTDVINIENSYLYDVQYGKEKDGYSYVNNLGQYVVMRYVDNLNWYIVIHGADGSIKLQDILPIVLGGILMILINAVAYLWCTKA